MMTTDLNLQKENDLIELKEELKPLLPFLNFYTDENLLIDISLKQGISFKDFNNYFPDITKKQLISLFDYCRDNKELSYFALMDLLK